MGYKNELHHRKGKTSRYLFVRIQTLLDEKPNQQEYH